MSATSTGPRDDPHRRRWPGRRVVRVREPIPDHELLLRSGRGRLEGVGSEEDGAATLAAAPAEEPAYSEHMVETHTRGALQLFVDGKLVGARPNDGVVCSPDVAAPALAAGSVEEAGQWTAPFAWPVVAVHLNLLPDGKVLTWGHAGEPQIWDPATGGFTPVPSPAELFCAGQTLNEAGKVVVSGGHISTGHGLPNMTVFDPSRRRGHRPAPWPAGDGIPPPP